MDKKYNLPEIEVLLSFITKRANKGDYKISLLKKLKHNFMFKTKVGSNNTEEMILYKDIESTIKGLEELFNEEEQYFCLNCDEPILFEGDSNYIITCNVCNWRNEFNDTPAISPIILLSKTFEDYSVQICYPLLDKSLLTLITDTQREAVEMYLNSPEKLTKKQYDVIYHHIYSKDLSKLSLKLKQLQSKIEFVKFFKSTNFLKKRKVNK